LEGFLLPDRVVSGVLQGAAADAEIAHFPSSAEHRLQSGRVGFFAGILEPRSLSDRVADTSQADRMIGLRFFGLKEAAEAEDGKEEKADQWHVGILRVDEMSDAESGAEFRKGRDFLKFVFAPQVVEIAVDLAIALF